MDSYINKFMKLVAEFETYQGSRHQEDILEYFLASIPTSQYRAHKTLHEAVHLDETMAYFKRVADKEAVFQPSPEIKRKPAMAFRLQAAHRHPQRGYKPGQSTEKRCFKCTGWGHRSSECPTSNMRCANCGGTDHKRAQCRVKVFRVSLTDNSVLGSDIEYESDSGDTRQEVDSLSEGPMDLDDAGLVRTSAVTTADHHSDQELAYLGEHEDDTTTLLAQVTLVEQLPDSVTS